MSKIDGIPSEYLWCRDVRHSWDENYLDADIVTYRGRDEIRQILRCERCTAKKVRRLTFGCMPIGNPRMIYPQGYLLKDQGRLTATDRAMIRKINVDKALGKKGKNLGKNRRRKR